jgi:hypothetical protein
MTAKFDISEGDQIATFLGTSFERAAHRAMLSTALRIVQHITTVIIPAEPRQPVDRGAYRAAWRASQLADGSAMITNAMPYAAVIEYGARAENIKIGTAMITALANWVIRKGLVKKRRGARGAFQARSEAIAMAWAIAKSMKKRGIFNGGTGLNVLEKAMKIVRKTFAEEIATEIDREFPT